MAGEVWKGDEKFVLNGTTYWFNFPRSGGTLGFSSSSPFASKSITGERSYADFDPFSAVAFSDMSGGMGQDRVTDSTKYYDAWNVDTRGGRVVLGPLEHYNATPVGLDSHADDLLDGTYTSATLSYYAVDSTTPKLGARFVVPTGITEIGRVWLPIKATVAASTVTVTISNDSSGSPGSSVASTTLTREDLRQWGSWVQAVFSSVASVLAGSTYWVTVEHSGAASSVQWYGAYSADAAYDAYDNAKRYYSSAWTTTTNYWHLIFWFDDGTLRPNAPLKFNIGVGEDAVTRLWGYAGRKLYYINASGTPTPVQDGSGNVYDTGSDITDAVWFRGASDSHAYLFLALGDSTDYKKFDANIGTEQWATVSSIQARKLCVHDNMLWRCDERNLVSASLDGTTFADSSTGSVRVGDAAYPVRNMVSWDGYLYCGKDDGLYQVSYASGYPTSGKPTAVKVLDFSAQVDANNFGLMVVHQGDLMFSLEQGLVEFTSGNVVTPITPDTGLNLSVSERALYRSAVSSLNVLWVTCEGSLGGSSSVLARVDGRWHPILTVPRNGDMLRSVYIEPGLYGDAPRVWYSAGLQVGFLQMPTSTQKRWLWDGMDWAVSGHVTYSWLDGGIRTINKDWYQLEVDCRKVGSGAGEPYLALYWRPDEDTAWAQVGANVTTEGITRLNFPVASYSPKAQIRLYLYRGTLNGVVTTPQVEAVVAKFLERPPDLRAFTRTYELGTHTTWRTGERRMETLLAQITELETLRQSAEPLTWHPHWGGTRSVHIVNYNCSERATAKENIGDVVTLQVVVTLQEMA